MLPKISIIVLHWNNFDLLKDTIESLKNQDYDNKEIIIVDNFSTDGSQDKIKETYPEYILIENTDNFGWAKGNNIGINYALEKGTDYILLCNNDIIIKDKNILLNLVNTIEENQQINVKIAGGIIYYFNHFPEKIHNCGYIFFPESETKGKYFNKFRVQNKLSLSDNLKIVDFVSGCFMLINKDVFEKVGFMDELFFLYTEEACFSFRAWKQNIVSVINTDVKIYHKVASSIIEHSPASIYYQFRNIYYLMKKHKKDIRFKNYFFIKYYRDLIRYIFKKLLSVNSLNRYSSIKCALKGFTDAVFLNKMGKKI